MHPAEDHVLLSLGILTLCISSLLKSCCLPAAGSKPFFVDVVGTICSSRERVAKPWLATALQRGVKPVVASVERMNVGLLMSLISVYVCIVVGMIGGRHRVSSYSSI